MPNSGPFLFCQAKGGFYSVFRVVIFSPLAARVRRARGESPKEALQKCAKCDKESKP